MFPVALFIVAKPWKQIKCPSEYRSGLPFPPPVHHVLSELFTMTCSSWVALQGMTHGFIVALPQQGSDT